MSNKATMMNTFFPKSLPALAPPTLPDPCCLISTPCNNLPRIYAGGIEPNR